jgi:adenylylsulfate kinase
MKPFTIWFTGVPGSGKTVLSKLLTTNLRSKGIACAMLDGFDVRKRTGDLLGFAASARKVHAIYCAVAASVLNDSGICVSASFVSPSRDSREEARRVVGDERFFEIYLTCKPDLAKARAPNPGWVGIHVPYEESRQVDLQLDTTDDKPEKSLELVLEMLQDRRAI